MAPQGCCRPQGVQGRLEAHVITHSDTNTFKCYLPSAFPESDKVHTA